MPLCVHCKTECGVNTQVCPKCGAILSSEAAEALGSADWPTGEDGSPESAVAILTAQTQMDADMKTALLGAFGVPVRIDHSALNDRFTTALFGNYLVFVDVLVPASRADEARALLESSGEDEATDSE